MGTAHLRLLALFSVVQQVSSWSISVPPTVTAVEGSCVLVPCQTQPHTRVIWYQYHAVNYPVVYDGLNPRSVEYQFIGRTSVQGEAARGNCSLLIENVTTKDNRIKVYVWIDPEAKSSQKFHEQTVTILVERTAPTLSIEREIVEGSLLQANCIINYSCRDAPPSLHWEMSPSMENFNVTTLSKELSGQLLVRETLHAVAKYDMHNSKVRCSAKFRSFTTNSQEISLNILYKPANVTIVQENKTLMEGGSVSVNCAVNSNPPPHTYSWLRRHSGRSSKITSTQSGVTQDNVTRSTSLSCLANNSIGAGQSDWLDLELQFSPLILNESFCNESDGVLKCLCLVEASPTASINWLVNENYTLQSSFTSVLAKKKNVVSGEISIAEKSHIVSCQAENPLGRDTRQLHVSHQSKPLSVLVWSMLLGTMLVLGCAMFIYRKYPRRRPVISVIECNTPPRSHSEDVQSDVQGEEGNAEDDQQLEVYDNDFVVEMRASIQNQQQQEQQQQDHPVPQPRQTKPMPVEKDERCNMDIYLNY